MTKQELIKRTATAVGVTQNVAQECLQATLNLITEELGMGKPITLVGFGKFHTTIMPAGTITTPMNGEEVEIPSRKRVRFKPSPLLKQQINEKE